jgi:hypothetical protein
MWAMGYGQGNKDRKRTNTRSIAGKIKINEINYFSIFNSGFL